MLNIVKPRGVSGGTAKETEGSAWWAHDNWIVGLILFCELPLLRLVQKPRSSPGALAGS